jgi:hypothetical protein
MRASNSTLRAFILRNFHQLHASITLVPTHTQKVDPIIRPRSPNPAASKPAIGLEFGQLGLHSPGVPRPSATESEECSPFGAQPLVLSASSWLAVHKASAPRSCPFRRAEAAKEFGSSCYRAIYISSERRLPGHELRRQHFTDLSSL